MEQEHRRWPSVVVSCVEIAAGASMTFFAAEGSVAQNVGIGLLAVGCGAVTVAAFRGQPPTSVLLAAVQTVVQLAKHPRLG